MAEFILLEDRIDSEKVSVKNAILLLKRVDETIQEFEINWQAGVYLRIAVKSLQAIPDLGKLMIVTMSGIILCVLLE